ncbi:hypothetical protein ACHAXN_011050 [Cyclotella atomus]
MSGGDANTVEAAATSLPTVTLVAKYGKEKIELASLPPSTSILEVKELLRQKTGILPMRQKMIGLKVSSGASSVADETRLGELKVRKGGDSNASVVHQFILMGTPEEAIFVDPSDKDDLPDIINDFDLDFNAGSDEWIEHKAKEENLQKFTEHTQVHIINPPRLSPTSGQCKPLLVLDLDHTLLDFSAKSLQDNSHSSHSIGSADDHIANNLKRPHMDDFLTWAYKYYDLVVWSQTSWRWLEIKLTELGMISHPGYKICFVLDKTSMFKIVSSKRSGKKVEHSVKPLQIIWSKFPHWSSQNTDDLARNFALNPGCGLKCTAYYRNKRMKKGITDGRGQDDRELLGWGRFLELLATELPEDQTFDDVDFQYWRDYVNGSRSFKK